MCCSSGAVVRRDPPHPALRLAAARLAFRTDWWSRYCTAQSGGDVAFRPDRIVPRAGQPRRDRVNPRPFCEDGCGLFLLEDLD